MNSLLSSRSTQLFIGAGVLLAGCVAGLVFEIMSIRTLFQQTQANVDLLGATLAEQEQFARTRTLLLASVPARNQLNSYFTTEETAVNFLEEIESLGATAGIIATLSSLDIQEGPPAKLTLSIRTEGSWQQVLYFLALLEKMPRRLVVTKTTLAEIPADDDVKTKRWRASFDIELLSFQAKK